MSNAWAMLAGFWIIISAGSVLMIALGSGCS